MSSLEDLYRDLSLALGDAVWAFARIEWITYNHINSYYSDSVDNLIVEIGFANRAEILKKIIKDKKPISDNRDKAIDAINKAIKLAKERNLIVHNPWKIWIDLDAKEFMTEIEKFAAPGKSINLDGVRAFVNKAEAVELELKEALNAL